MPKKFDPNNLCSEPNCGIPVHIKTFCRKHYLRQYNYGRLHKKYDSYRRSHELYMLWADRHKRSVPEWGDFWVFLKDVGKRPAKNFEFIRPNSDKPFGPDNFKWRERLVREETESEKDWCARKFISRFISDPTNEVKRYYLKQYGLTFEQYKQILKAQNNVCAICKCHEKAIDKKTHAPKSLAVDHCHTTGKIRGLLCWRCNVTIGRAADNVELLLAMVEYIKQTSINGGWFGITAKTAVRRKTAYLTAEQNELKDNISTHNLWYFHRRWRQIAQDTSPEWPDFWTFVKGIGKRPSKKLFLAKKDKMLPYGPSNFQWAKRYEV